MPISKIMSSIVYPTDNARSASDKSQNDNTEHNHSESDPAVATALHSRITRRGLLYGLGATVLTCGIAGRGARAAAETTPVAHRIVLKTGHQVPPVGLGTWLTFDIDPNGRELTSRQRVLEAFVRLGGGMIDSSPMYGRSEKVIGILSDRLASTANIFSATKVWSAFESRGPTQLAASHRLWNQPSLDLVHVHNLLRWKTHLKMLQAAKESGSVRYVGLTTSHGRRHDELEQLLKSEDIDAVQFTYNIAERDAEQRLLFAAQDKGLAVIINRPFATGQLFSRYAKNPLPEWAAEFDCNSWAGFFLKFVLSHPAVTCAIPATRQPEHMIQNMRAGTGRMPDQKMRLKMIQHIKSL